MSAFHQFHLDMEPATIEKLVKLYCDATGTSRFGIRQEFIDLAHALELLPDNHRRDDIVRRIDAYDGTGARDAYDAVCALAFAQEATTSHPIIGQLEQYCEYIEDIPQTDFRTSAFYALTKK